MDFKTLHELIPHATGKKNHVLTMSPYNGVTLALPGRHQLDTPVPGADFVVMTNDTELGWVNHQFSHDDIFADVERKVASDSKALGVLMNQYAQVVFGADPEDFKWERGKWNDSLHPKTFLYSVQCLAVAEYRRYERFEGKAGGRYLPLRFAYGIAEGKWTAADCKAVQRRGRPGVEMLERQNGFDSGLSALRKLAA